MATEPTKALVVLPFKLKDYLTDGKRLYRVEHISIEGVYTLENCDTEFTYETDLSFIKSLTKVKRR